MTHIPVLYYHFIERPPANARIKGLFTTPKQFEWQIKRLSKKGFRFISFEDIIQNNYDPNESNIIITFDDGCQSVYTNAFPVLKKYGAKAVFYIVTNSIGKKNMVWEQNEHTIPLNIVTEEEIRELSENGFEIGSHLCNHVDIRNLKTEEMEMELSMSKSKLQEILKKEVVSVAYPFGYYNQEAMTQAQKAGYHFGVTTNPGNNIRLNPYEFERYSVKGYALRHYIYFYKLLKRITR